MILEDVPLLSKINSGFHRLTLHRRIFHIQRQIANQAVMDPDQDPVLFFNASTRLRGLSQNAAFSLIAAWGLQMAGVPVIHFGCHSGMSNCVLGSVQGDLLDPPPCQGCIADTVRFTQPGQTVWFDFEKDDQLAAVLRGLSVNDLKEVAYNGHALGELVLPSLRWTLRRHHLEDDETTRRLYRSYIQSASSIARSARRALDQHTPRAVVVFNGLQYPEAMIQQVAQERGLRVITHEVGFQPLSAFFTDGEATRYPINIPDSFELSSRENERLDRYLEKRFQGNFTMAGIQFWSEMQGMDDELQSRLEAFEGVVPVFTNVVFDTSQAHANTLFSDMFDWLSTVVKIIKDHPRTFFIIRAHPDEMREGKESRQSVARWVEENGITDLDNVGFIGPDQPLSSYELIQRSKFVMVYNSSIGLEASLLGAPVLCAGQARYTQYETVMYPDSKSQYLEKAYALLQNNQIKIPDSYANHARKFLYYQLFKVSLPFDQYLTEYPSTGYVQLREFPLSRLDRENSPTIRVLVDGILHGNEFVLEKEARNVQGQYHGG